MGTKAMLAGFVVVWLASGVASGAAFAQADCLKSLPVTKPNASIQPFPWLPGSTPGQAGMTCMAAERLRERIYVENQPLLNGSALRDRDTYLTAANAAVADAKRVVRDLQQKVDANAGRSALLVAAELTLYTLGKADTLISCLFPDVGPEKGWCAVRITGLALATAHILTGNVAQNEFSQLAADGRADVAKAQTKLAALNAALKSSDVDQAQQNTVRMFGGLCRAIQHDCE